MAIAETDTGEWSLLELIPDGVVVANRSGEIVAVNGPFLTLLGYRRNELVGMPLLTIIPERFHQRHRHGFDRWADDTDLRLEGQTVELVASTHSGDEVAVTVGFRQIERPDGPVVLGFFRPAEASAPRTDLALRLMELFGERRPFHRMLPAALRELCTGLGWEHGLVWTDGDDGALHVLAAWSTDETAEQSYVDEATRWSFAKGSGLVGSVMEQREPVWVADLASDPRFVRNDAAARHHLRSAVLFPLLAGGNAVGVVELVSSEERGIDLTTHEVVKVVGVELGTLLRERIAAEQSESARRRLDLAVDAAEIGIWNWDVTQDVVEMSPRLAALHGLPEATHRESFETFVGRVLPEHRAVFRQRLQHASADGQRFDHLYQVDVGGRPGPWLRGSGQPLFDLDGELRSVTGVAFDVSESLDYAITQERALRQATLVATIGEILTSDWLSQELLQKCTEAICEATDAAFTRIWTIETGESELELQASAGMYTHLDGGHARIPVGSFKIGRIAAFQRPHLTNDVLDDDEISDPEWARREGMVAFAGYPLVVADRCVGVLALFAREELDVNTLKLLGTIADMISLAYSRAEAYRAMDEVASALQRSLLPPELPTVPGLTLAASYQPSIGELSGDFYDVFPLRGEDWGLVIGDVRGKGPSAAAATSLARHTIRAAAMLRRGTDAPLQALNTAMQPPHGDMCTAVFARVRRRRGSLAVTLSRAGHPPPVIRRRDGTVETPTGGGPLLGLFDDVAFPEREIVLQPGDAIVFFTDGVLEARRGGEFFGEERVARLIAGAAVTSAEVLSTMVLDASVAFHDSRHIDDIAVLVLRAE